MSDPIPSDVHLCAGEFHFGGGHVRVHTLLGTCVAIALWHPGRRIGGLCHYLLPTRGANPVVDGAPGGLYADEVMAKFADALRHTQTLPRDYIVKVAGGGHMFPEQLPGDCRAGACDEGRRAGCASVGCKNIHAARTLLKDRGYNVSAENVGGEGSRQVILELWSGDVWVRRGAAMAGGARAVA